MNINFIKCHGSGNDFIIVDVEGNGIEQNTTKLSELSIVLCNREIGIGSDGVLYYLPSEKADCGMRMFNPDGSEAEMCGNGLRCVGRYASESLAKNTLTVETMKAILQTKIVADIYPNIMTVEVEIAPLSLDAKSLPMAVDGRFINRKIEELSQEISFTALSVPNPHLIGVVNDICFDTLLEVGQKANNHILFPRGVNVSFLSIINSESIFVATFERGVGITNSCGTAMSASAYTACLLGYFDYQTAIKVVNKGGFVTCMPIEDEKILLSGNATYVFTGNVIFGDETISITQKHLFLNEESKYNELVKSIKIIEG